jgi:hypothetical protein
VDGFDPPDGSFDLSDDSLLMRYHLVPTDRRR